MSTAIKQDLSLGKLKRAVSSSVSNYTTISSLGQNGGGGNGSFGSFGNGGCLNPRVVLAPIGRSGADSPLQ